MKEYITWSEQYSVNFKAIDEQHKQVFKLLNDIFILTRSGKQASRKALEQLGFRLRLFTETHFVYEERVLEMLQYPRLNNHKTYHRRMENRTHAITQDLVDNVKDPQDLLLFLKDWWQKHIQGNDKDYVPLVEKLEL